MSTLQECLDSTTARLEAAGAHTPMADAREILAQTLGIPAEEIERHASRPVAPGEIAAIEAAVAQREKRIPLSRIFNITTFCGLQLQMAPGVFNIYPESEAMVDHAVIAFQNRNEPFRILDVGTGSGCLLLALLHHLPFATGVGVDLSQTALGLAQTNAVSCGLSARAAFRKSDWSDPLGETFDLVVSNPPRVATGDLPYLMPEMRLYDPVAALDGGPDGLKYFHRLCKDLPHLANPGGMAFLQIGPRYAKRVYRLLTKEGYATVEMKNNYRGEPSCVAVVNAKKRHRLLDIFRWL